MSGRTIIVVLAFLILASSPAVCRGEKPVEDPLKPRLESLHQALVSEGFTEDQLVSVFSDERLQLYPWIVSRSGKGVDYLGRRFGLLTRKSVNGGKLFIQKHRDLLRRIEGSFGVDKEVLVSILRIETNFGSYTGTYPVFNSLLTLSLIENRRSLWARKELGYLLAISRDEGKDIYSIKGSWAGAFGIPQFIPSSYVLHGADGNGDGRVDLYNHADALASVARYLKAHGWSAFDDEAQKQAIWAYNHCDSYVKGVQAYARALRSK